MQELSSPETKNAIIVSGYYRSGTSALVGCLSELGFYSVGDAESNEHNPKGFFESTDLIRLDIRIMGALDSIWSDLTPYPDGWEKRPDIQFYRRDLTEILGKQLDGQNLVAVKHPHICRLFPLYAQSLKDLGFQTAVLHTHRDPYIIADSQAKKNFLTRAHALALWASYVTSSEFYARGYHRTWVDYRTMLDSRGMAIYPALDGLGIPGLPKKTLSFMTKSLDRSKSSPEDGLYRPLHHLVAEICDAINTNPGNQKLWDDLRERANDIGQFITEIGRSGNRAAIAVAGQPQNMVAQRGFSTTFGANTHATRPPERGDSAEQKRIGGLIKHAEENGGLPSVSVHLAITEESTPGEIKDTLSSLTTSWSKPDILVVYQVGNTVDIDLPSVNKIMRFETRAELSKAVFAGANDSETDYAAFVTAGDQIEPDAISRFKLAALQSDADILYSDEIANGPNGPWIRAKPRLTPTRLIESCIVGDWAWYRTKALRDLGGFNSTDYAGAEEQDMQLRLMRNERKIFQITEALFLRGMHTNRDGIPIEDAIARAQNAITDHIKAVGLKATIKTGAMIGMFVMEMADDAPRAPVVIGLRCQDDTDTVQRMINRLIPNMHSGDHLVLIKSRGELSPNFSSYLEKIEAEICPKFPAISIIECPTKLGEAINILQKINPYADVAILDCVSAPNCDDIINRMATLRQAANADIIAPKVFFRDHDQRASLFGPMLFGCKDRMGAGYDAGSPGPGGWLATTQVVDAVSGPLVLIKNGLAVSQDASHFAEICSLSHNVYWTPHYSVEIPYPKIDPELSMSASMSYKGVNHHPSMAVAGNPLMLEGVRGLITGTGSENSTLISSHGNISGGRILSAARCARDEYGASISLVMDPVDPFSVRRAIAQGRPWIRVNPDYFFEMNEDVIRSSANIWSALPTLDQRKIVLATDMNFATSERIASHIRGMGGKVAVSLPKLTRDSWLLYKPDDGERHVAMIIREPGVDVPWLKELIDATSHALDYVIVSGEEIDNLPGNVAHETPPVFEDGWIEMISKLQISMLVRPTPGADWCDDYIVRLAIAAGCKTIVGEEFDHHNLPVDKSLSSKRPDAWTKAILALAEQKPDREGFVLDDLADLWLTSVDVAHLSAIDKS